MSQFVSPPGWSSRPSACFLLALGILASLGICKAIRADDVVDAKQNPKANQDDPAWQDVELVTKDRVQLGMRFFAGNEDKQTIPIILLHGWTGPDGPGSGRDLYGLATSLQAAGHAVAIPDLRGHGQSLRVKDVPHEINRDRFRPADIRDMMLDVEAVRSFLVAQNNRGKLNLELLCVVGFEMGSVVALNWIQYDLMVPSFPTLKQGQDVKGFVLVSPEKSFKGFAIGQAMANEALRRDLSAMIIYGKLGPLSNEAKRLYNILRRSRRRGTSTDTNDNQDLFLVELDTRLRGSKLLEAPGVDVSSQIVNFVDRRIASLNETFPWRDRTRP